MRMPSVPDPHQLIRRLHHTPFTRTAQALWSVLALLLVLPMGRTGAEAVAAVPTGFVNESVVTGLAEPNSMAFLPDGRLLFTEQRTGRVRVVANGQLGATPLLTVPSLNAVGYERGLQGIAVDPRWPSVPYVYLFLSRTGERLRLVRYTASGDLVSPVSTNLTLASPYVVLDDILDTNPNHNSGCLRFGVDGMLFVSLGEDEDFCAADDSTTLKGSILRLDVRNLPAGSGGPPARSARVPANPSLASTNTEARLVYAYGFRNPWRIHVDPSDGRVFGADVGEVDFEEINEIVSGDYYGWPYREGNLVMDRAQWCPEPSGPGNTAYHAPIVSMSRNPSQLTAIVSAGVYRWPLAPSAAWPGAYEGDYFYAEYYSGFLRRLRKNGNVWQPAAPVAGQPNATDWATGLTAAVDFLVGPDGSLYWLSQFNGSFSGSTGSLNRIRFTGVPLDSETVGPIEASMSATPNPFGARTELWFRLARAEGVRLTVHDATGRRVRQLWSGRAEAGDQRVEWDGRGEDGREVPAGVYLARLEREGASVTTRVLRIR